MRLSWHIKMPVQCPNLPKDLHQARTEYREICLLPGIQGFYSALVEQDTSCWDKQKSSSGSTGEFRSAPYSFAMPCTFGSAGRIPEARGIC
jgi:hypothetical protein